VINWFESSVNQNVIMINTHPQRWTDNLFEWYFELLKQNIKNVVKKFIVQSRSDY